MNEEEMETAVSDMMDSIREAIDDISLDEAIDFIESLQGDLQMTLYGLKQDKENQKNEK